MYKRDIDLNNKKKNRKKNTDISQFLESVN